MVGVKNLNPQSNEQPVKIKTIHQFFIATLSILASLSTPLARVRLLLDGFTRVCVVLLATVQFGGLSVASSIIGSLKDFSDQMCNVPLAFGGRGIFQRQRNVDVDFGWNLETKSFGNLDQIQRIHVKYFLVRVTGVGLQVASVAVSCRLVQIIIFFNQLFQLSLHIRNFRYGKRVLIQRHLGMLQVSQKAQFG